MGRQINKYTAGVVVFVAVGAWTYGFAFAIFIQAIGEPGFFVYFKLDPNSAYTASIEGAVNSLFAAGCASGCMMQGWLGDWLGRKRTIIVSQLFALIGGALCAGAVNVGMLIACRFIQGVGLGQSLTLVSLYITEVANKNNRGLLNGLTACGLATGYVVCSFAGFGTYFSKNEMVQFRLLLALGVVGPLITLAGIYWVPESPRWLAWQGRRDEAWAVLRRLHYDPVDDPLEEASHAEFQQIVLQVEHDKQQNVTFRKMFTVPSWRRRTLTAVFLLFATQCTGILGIGNFQLLLYSSLGLTGWLPLLFYCMYTMIGTAPNFASSLLMDRLGRRTLLLLGYVVVTLMLIVEMVLQKVYVGSTNTAGNGVTVAFLWIWVGCYGFFIDPPQFVYVAEIFPTTLRAKGIALGFAAYFVGAITFTTPAATAARTIGWKMYLVYMACNVVSIVIIYFFVPETKNLSLEEIGDLFGDEVVVHLTADGHHLVEEEMKVTQPVCAEVEKR
ncbi:General substrate transporter [Niveomyces insectorum RCEF 264]|uniref:General substrate transporter n=1 Tax=Niveomyces insectorum RCEF 264 TaxID=1081102 RepID=A0A167NS26_9HYPO|nr:General substrate transporter [Niveomyces insectorum RCEF 264]